MIERIDSRVYEAETFLQDLRVTADLLGARFSEPTTRRMLEIFDAEFRTCVLQLKAASKAGSGLNYRFFYNGPKDLTRVAQEAGLIAHHPTPLNTLQAEVLATFPRAMRTGLDFDAEYGLAKEWTFTGQPIPVEEIYRLRSLPDSFRRHADFFCRHGLRYVGFLASDYHKGTMNVYFSWDADNRTEAWLQRIVCETGGPRLPRDLVKEIIHSQAVLGGVGTTFSHDHPGLLRWCVYSLEVPYAEGETSPVPLPRLPERLAKLRDSAPTLNACPSYHMGWSFGQEGYYRKLEKNYARDASYFFTTQMGANLTHPAPEVAAR